MKNMFYYETPIGKIGIAEKNNKNPIPIFIPCHRVLSSTGNLTGYLSGLEVKSYLLELEKQYGDF